MRYFNPVGAHNSGLIGEELNNKPSNLLPVILKVSRGEYKELSIFEIIKLQKMEPVLEITYILWI